MNETMPQHEASAEALIEALKQLPELVSADDDLIRRGRFVRAEILIGIGSARCYVTIEDGRVTDVESSPQRMRSAAFAISGPPASWRNFWQPVPRPGWHDLFAMNKRGEMTIEGNLLPFMQNLQYFKDLMALPRALGGKTVEDVRNAG